MDENNNNFNVKVTIEDTDFTQKPESQGPRPGEGKAVASMVLGIAGIALGCCFAYGSFPCVIVGLILGIISLKKQEPGRGMAIAGIVLGVAALISGIVGLFVAIANRAILESGFWESIMNGGF